MTERRNIPAMQLGMSPEDIAAVLKGIRAPLQSGQLTLGAEGKRFEEEFAEFAGAPFACAVNSGTAALEIALRVFGVEGKEVLVPANTFFATPAAVAHAGGVPRFVDCDPYTLDLDFESLRKRWNPRCAGVIAVHIGGPVAPNVAQVQDFCRERKMFLLEDAAHAHGSTLNGKQAGSFGDAAAFSFYPTKVMTSGEGGMLVTRDDRIYKDAVIYRDQGKESFSGNYHVRMGYNWRMSELHAVLGRVQLKRLPANLARRREIARRYDEALRAMPEVRTQATAPGSTGNYYKYPVLLPGSIRRDELKRRIREQSGVGLSGEVYAYPCHRQPIFVKYADAEFPGADQACDRQVCLPLYPLLTDADADYVIEAFRAALQFSLEEVCH